MLRNKGLKIGVVAKLGKMVVAYITDYVKLVYSTWKS